MTILLEHHKSAKREIIARFQQLAEVADAVGMVTLARDIRTTKAVASIRMSRPSSCAARVLLFTAWKCSVRLLGTFPQYAGEHSFGFIEGEPCRHRYDERRRDEGVERRRSPPSPHSD